MAGFAIHVRPSGRDFSNPLKLVDLGACDDMQCRSFLNIGCAWTRWTGSRQLTVHENTRRMLFVEGEPDRLPTANETAATWLPGRTGSFRGFEIEVVPGGGPARLCAFVDPLGTRPIFVLNRDNAVLVADKLSTVVANVARLECNWGPILEAAVLGSTYSADTTVRGIVQLPAGGIVEVEAGKVGYRQGTVYELETGARPDPDAPRRLGDALRHAVEETWTDLDCRLTLSGGLDSRLILGIAEPGRKTMTFEWEVGETPIALQVAAACESENRVIPFREEDYCAGMLSGYLVTGAMQQSRFVNNLGMATNWRRSGIPGITHGYFHNTVFRGWMSSYWQRYPDTNTPLARYMKKKAHFFDMFGHYPLRHRERVLQLLSPDGRELIARQLGALADSIESVVFDGFDLTFERFVLNRVARQIYFGIFLGWIEEIDVVSPVFHEASMRWYATTHPADRQQDQAIIQLYQQLGRGLADIPDYATGRPIRPRPPRPPAAWRNQFWFPPARALVHAARRLNPTPCLPRPPPQIAKGLHRWKSTFRQAPILAALEEGIATMQDTGLYDRVALGALLDDYLAHDTVSEDVLWAIAVGGQLAKFVATAGAGGSAVRNAPVAVVDSS